MTELATPDGNALIEATVNGRKVLFAARDLVGSGTIAAIEEADYSVSRRDVNSLIKVTSGSGVVVKVRPASQSPVPEGVRISFAQMGAGQITFVAGDGVTINTPETLITAKQYAVATLVNTGTNEWLLVGNLEAA